MTGPLSPCPEQRPGRETEKTVLVLFGLCGVISSGHSADAAVSQMCELELCWPFLKPSSSPESDPPSPPTPPGTSKTGAVYLSAWWRQQEHLQSHKDAEPPGFLSLLCIKRLFSQRSLVKLSMDKKSWNLTEASQTISRYTCKGKFWGLAV